MSGNDFMIMTMITLILLFLLMSVGPLLSAI
jgi:hypothetical protein